MNTRTLRGLALYTLASLPFLGLAALSAPAQEQESVAEAARRARQDKKEEPKPKKVYTDDDVKATPGTVTTAAVEPPPGTADTKPANDKDAADSQKEEKTEKNDEATWRKKFKDAYDKLDMAQKELDILQRETDKAQVQYYSDPQKALEEQYSRKEINDRDTKIAAKKQEIEQIKLHISDMEDNLRKSGGDSGWARP